MSYTLKTEWSWSARFPDSSRLLMVVVCALPSAFPLSRSLLPPHSNLLALRLHLQSCLWPFFHPSPAESLLACFAPWLSKLSGQTLRPILSSGQASQTTIHLPQEVLILQRGLRPRISSHNESAARLRDTDRIFLRDVCVSSCLVSLVGWLVGWYLFFWKSDFWWGRNYMDSLGPSL